MNKLSIILFLFSIACSSGPKPHSHSKTKCEAAQDHLVEMHCVQATPRLESGVYPITWAETCQRAENSSVGSFHPECVINTSDCFAAEKCATW